MPYDTPAPAVSGYPASPGIQIPTSPQPSGDPQLAYRNNNPGNLKFVGQAGAMPGEKGFARFSSPTAGAQALHDQIAIDQQRGLSLQDFITKYAPPEDQNDTAGYIKSAAKTLNADPTTPINSLQRTDLAKFVAKHESGTDLSAFQPKSQSWLDPYIPADATAAVKSNTAPVTDMPAIFAPLNRS